MNIVIVGCGNLGMALAEKLSEENHDITVVDVKDRVVEDVSNLYDVMGIAGSGISVSTLKEAGVEEARVLIAVMDTDEKNLLCCLLAKSLTRIHTIARVTNPDISNDSDYIKGKLGLSMIINPQKAAAMEISRLLKYPSALEVDTFARSRVELLSYELEENSILEGMKVSSIPKNLGCEILIPIVERDDVPQIPNGDFVFKSGDKLSVMGTHGNLVTFFRKLGTPIDVIDNVMIVGGSKTAFYLASNLISMGIKVKIIERDESICEELAEMLPKAMIICGDATDKDLLMEEGLDNTDAFVTATNMDEENMMLGLYAKQTSNAKVIIKVHRPSYMDILDTVDIGSVVYPRSIAAESIVKYVRARGNTREGSNIETLYFMANDKVEALEFTVSNKPEIVNIPLKDLKFKKDVIIGCITNSRQVVIPNGNSVIKEGDTVIVITKQKGFLDVMDILR